MANMMESVKSAWIKSMEAVGNTATNIANNTKYKVTEMNLVSRRHELLNEFSARAYEIWQAGELKLPQELDSRMAELYRIDEELNKLHMEKFSGVTAEADQQDASAEPEAIEGTPAPNIPLTEDHAEDNEEDSQK